MRILYLNPIAALGGSERSLLDLLASLREKEPSWELHLIAGADGPLLEAAARMGVQAEALPMPEKLLVFGASPGAGKVGLLRRALSAGLGAANYVKLLRARVSMLKPDLIHSNGAKFHILMPALGRSRPPVILHVRDFFSGRKLLRRALRWAAPAAALALANSEATAADARTVLPGVPVRVLLNGIDVEYFSPGPARGESLDELAGLPPAESGVLRAGLLASYARWKGQDLLLRAAAKLLTDMPGLLVRFYIVGGPIYKTQGAQFSLDELRARVLELGLAGRVGLIPFQSEPREIYRALDVAVHCSTRPEPFGRTIVEAMACGLPVIASQSGGAAELFTPEIEALGTPLNDAPALAAALARLLDDAPLRAALGRNARRAAVQRFSRDRLGAELSAIYRGLHPADS